MKSWKAPLLLLAVLALPLLLEGAPVDAPTGFDGLTNGLVSQAVYDQDRAQFERIWSEPEGLGPAYDDASCAGCHALPVTGGNSPFALLRGRNRTIRQSAICPDAQEFPDPGEPLSQRLTPSLLGYGFVEAVADTTLAAIRAGQPASLRGTLINVPVLEAPGTIRAARFGWKNQNASLLSNAALAFLDQIGITSAPAPVEPSVCDAVADPEAAAQDLDAVTRFVRATKAPPRDTVLAASPDARTGANLFSAIGCNICHVPNLTTAPAGTVINGGTFTIPLALGNLTIHPYSDFLLHDVGTSFTATPEAFRTAPLWGLRTRFSYLHDGSASTVDLAIRFHAGQAVTVTQSYLALNATQRNQLLTFLSSL